MKNLRKSICIFIVLTILLSMVVILPSEAKYLGRTSVINSTFENNAPTEDFSSSVSCDASYVGGSSKLKVVSQKGEAINGVSIVSQYCDMRWWALCKYDKKMYLGLSVILTSPGEISFSFGATTQDSQTGNAFSEGAFFFITDASGVPVLRGNDRKKVADLSYNEVYRIGVEVERGSSTYTLTVNGTAVSDSCQFKGKVYQINNVALLHSRGTMVMDDIYFDLEGTKYPQINSTQKITFEEPELETFSNPDYSKTRVYFNDSMHSCYSGTNGKNIKIPMNILTSAIGITPECAFSPDDKVSLSTVQDLFDAKIWFDEATNTVLITTGEFKNDGILRVFRGKMYMNGEPFYEISFNKFDLFWQVYAGVTKKYTGDYPDKTCLEDAEDALSALHERGFKTIRVFCSEGGCETVCDPEEKELFFEATEKMFELCNKYDIKVVVCLNLISNKFVAAFEDEGMWLPKGETYLDIIANPESESRANLKNYLKEYIARFKDNDAVLMWEINNEGNLLADVGITTNCVTYSLLQLAEFYDDIANVIREEDPVHMITTGDSTMRGTQWNLLLGVLAGENSNRFKTDSVQERRTALALLNKNYDIISMHPYDSGLNGATTMKEYMEDAAILGKALYAGETNVSTGIAEKVQNGDSGRTTDAAVAEVYREFLDTYVEAGVQLTHWWAYHTDRASQYATDLPYGIRAGFEGHDAALAVFQQENEKLREKYVVNGYSYNINEGYEATVKLNESMPFIIAGVVSAVVCVAVVIIVVIIVGKKRKILT